MNVRELKERIESLLENDFIHENDEIILVAHGHSAKLGKIDGVFVPKVKLSDKANLLPYQMGFLTGANNENS